MGTLRSCKLSDMRSEAAGESEVAIFILPSKMFLADWKSERTVAALNLPAEKKNLKGNNLEQTNGLEYGNCEKSLH